MRKRSVWVRGGSYWRDGDLGNRMKYYFFLDIGLSLQLYDLLRCMRKYKGQSRDMLYNE